MEKRITIAFALLSLSYGGSFAQLSFNGGGKIIINGGTSANKIYVVLASPPAVPITTSGAGVSGIIMEGEYNIAKYKLGTSTTAITVPYVSSALESFPLTVNGITAGTGAGSIEFSTKKAVTRATGWDNSAYLPSDVLNMQGGIPLVANNSAYTYDRFWIIDATGYTAKPAVNLNFTYINAEAAGNGGNSMAAGNLRAQVWDNVANTWNNFAPAGTNTTGGASGTVNSVAVPSAQFFRSWTLNDRTQPLPVQLTEFKGACNGNNIELKWTTLSEQNSSYFTIEKSYDGADFFVLANVAAVFSSNQAMDYAYSDDANPINNIIYYRLSETDVNSGSKLLTTIPVESCISKEEGVATLFYSNENIYLNVFSISSQPVVLRAYDLTGRLIYNNRLAAEAGNNNYTVNPGLSQGVYIFDVITKSRHSVKRILIEK
jgi:hypothetical protein